MPRTPLLRPEAYFDREDVTADQAAVVVLLCGVVGGLLFAGTMLLLEASVRDPPAALHTAVQKGVVLGLVVFVLVSFVNWVFSAGLLHLIVAVVGDGEGGFHETLLVAGWGQVPQTLAFGVLVALAWRDIAETPIAAEPEALTATTRAAFAVSGPVSWLPWLAGAAWIVAVWGPGLHRFHRIPLGGSYVAAALVSAFGLLNVLV